MMKKTSTCVIVIAAVAAVLLMAGPSMAAERIVVLIVPDMECGSKEIQAEMALTGLNGVSAVEIDADEKTATVTFDDEAVGVEDMKQALEEFDMSASKASSPEEE
jgi:copper chaperone CopZ